MLCFFREKGGGGDRGKWMVKEMEGEGCGT